MSRIWYAAKQIQTLLRMSRSFFIASYLQVTIWFICLSRRLRQITDGWNIDKSRYFAITKFNYCFIIRSPSLFPHFNHSLMAQGSDLPFFTQELIYNYAWAEYYLLKKTHLESIIIFCSQLKFTWYICRADGRLSRYW